LRKDQWEKNEDGNVFETVRGQDYVRDYGIMTPDIFLGLSLGIVLRGVGDDEWN
jgi:hypothetical protein